MILPHTYPAALLLMIFAMLAWGSWANLFKLTGKWRFELFYFDFAIGMLGAALIYALSVGSLGFDGFSFMDDLMHAGKRQWLFGFLGGVVFTLGNMLLVGAVSVAGMAVSFPVAMGVALVFGALLSYLLHPIGNPLLMFTGCAILVAAVAAGAAAYKALAIMRHEAAAKAGKAKSTMRKVSWKGVLLAVVAGFFLGCFYPLVARAQVEEVGLGPYAVAVVFALGAFLSTFVFNLFFMNLPVEGEPLELQQYFRGSFRRHALGWAAGALWSSGAVAGFAAAASEDVRVAPAIGYALGQPGATLVSALCGLFLWKEFAGTDARARSFVAIMLVLFLVGIAMIAVR